MASTVVRRDRLRRWALVAAVAAVLVSLPSVVSAALPSSVAPIDPARLRDLIARSASQPYSGYAESTGGMDVPDLPNLSQVSSLLNGTTKVRTWYDSPERWRVDPLSLGSERDTHLTAGRGVGWGYRPDKVPPPGRHPPGP